MAELGGLSLSVLVPGIAVGWVHAEALTNGTSPEALAEEIRHAVAAAAAAGESPERAARKSAARDMLRFGVYKPTGRGKPASEYLLNAAVEGRFPAINTLVDINNLVSLEAQLPISIVDLDLAAAEAFVVRRGREGESYVFNPSGQVLELRDLLLAARLPGDVPCASPIKDCQETKTHGGTTRVLGLVYAPSGLGREAGDAAERMAELIRRHAGARSAAGVAELKQ